jgi:hypothetical protein
MLTSQIPAGSLDQGVAIDPGMTIIAPEWAREE